MNMIINSTDNQLAPQIVAETEGFDNACFDVDMSCEPGVTQIRFTSNDVQDFREATILLREAIGQVRGLSDSLIGHAPRVLSASAFPMLTTKKSGASRPRMAW